MIICLSGYRDKPKPETGRNEKILPKKAMIMCVTERGVQSILPKEQCAVEDKGKVGTFSLLRKQRRFGTQPSWDILLLTYCLSHSGTMQELKKADPERGQFQSRQLETAECGPASPITRLK